MSIEEVFNTWSELSVSDAVRLIDDCSGDAGLLRSTFLTRPKRPD